MKHSIDFKGFPSTRYQGSKRKLLPWLYENISTLKFTTALDMFGGTATVSYLLKKMNKHVTFNDYLKSNYYVAKALIENDNVTLSDGDISYLLNKHKTISYDTFVQRTFSNIYYTEKENKWIDQFLSNWQNLGNIYPYHNHILEYKKALAFSAFSQSALKKRPFNLFHRANLDLRLNHVKRTFGNKTSWEGSFDEYFRYFVLEINKAVFDNGKKNTALNLRVNEFQPHEKFDMIYIDPPYMRKGVSSSDVDYMRFYHFLEGCADPDTWPSRINYNSKNLRMNDEFSNEWISSSENRKAFENLFNIFKDSIIVISYKQPGLPSKKQLNNSLKKYKRKVVVTPGRTYHYALNRNNGFHKEYQLIGIDK